MEDPHQVETEGFDTQTAAKVVACIVVTLPLHGTSFLIYCGESGNLPILI